MPELDGATIEKVAAAFFRGQVQLNDEAEKYSLDELVRGFEGTRRGMLRLLNGLSEAQINYNPDPNTYSLSEVVSHLVAAQGNTYNAFLDIASSTLPHVDPVPRDAGGGAEKGLTGAILQERLQKATTDWISVARQTYTPDTNIGVEVGNFNGGGKVSHRGAMLFQIAHDLDHFKQAQGLRRSPLFPAKETVGTEPEATLKSTEPEAVTPAVTLPSAPQLSGESVPSVTGDES